jgi:hypothetical protein
MSFRTNLTRLAACVIVVTFACTSSSRAEPHKSNTTTGLKANDKLTTGKNNTADGFTALQKNTTGNFNTAVGSKALKKNTGDSNVAMGFEALFKNTGGQFNVAIGDGAMKFNLTGSNNVALGMDAGALTNGNDNILIDHMGVAGRSGEIRLGTNGIHTKTYIAGKIFGDGSGLTGVVASGVSGGNLAVTGSGLSASLVLAPFDPFGNDPGTRISAIDDGGFGAHLDFLTKPGGAATNNLSTRMRITSEGNVGIGTSFPNSKLHVDGDGVSPSLRVQVSGSSKLIVDPNGGTSIGAFSVPPSNGLFVADKVGINNATPEAQLHVNISDTGVGQESLLQLGKNSSGTLVLGSRTFGTGLPFNLELFEGQAFKPGGGSWGVVSDRRLKKDIEPLTGALDRLMKLRPVTYEYKEPEKVHQFSGTQIGFNAQEVEEIFPEWVTENQDGYKTLTIRSFESLAVQALHDLRKEKDDEISALRANNEALKKKLEALSSRDSAFEARVARIEKAMEGNSTIPVNAPLNKN